MQTETETVSRIPYPTTPGPWTVEEHGITAAGRERVIVNDSDGMQLADCGWASSKVATANARLVAAAPDLLEALKRAVEVLDAEGIIYGNCDDEPLDVLSAAREAIEKAEAK